jgi:NAD(P)-dependent dehydrogenase (short-subunit alcohol dehydrogenase family)
VTWSSESVKLSGVTALVTGASRGIGAEIARTFARAGASVVLVARTRDDLEKVAAECAASGAAVLALTADVASDADVERVLRETLTQFNSVHVLVNSAGILGPVGRFDTNDLNAWWHAIDVNLGGTLRFARAVVPHMRARRAGRIINLSGGGATKARSSLSAYAVSKAAVVRLTETLAEELRGDNVHVNAIGPGPVDTRIQDDLLEAGARGGQAAAEVRAMRATGRGWVPARLAAELALFLASPASDGLTGKLISAPHDPWREWAGQGAVMSESSLYTLRRLDPFTMRQLRESL